MCQRSYSLELLLKITVAPQESTRRAGAAKPRLSGDVPLELNDRLLLFFDHGFDEITNRDHADDLLLFDDR